MSTRVLLADDHAVVRTGLRALLSDEPDIELVGEAEDGYEVLRMAEELRPNLVLMDISMPGQSGMEAMQKLKKELPETHIILLTVHEDEGLLRKAIQTGASGYVIKRAAESELIHAIRAVLRGDIYIHPAMTRALLKDIVPLAREPHIVKDILTQREIEVLKMITRGYTNNQIAAELSISTRTVEGHRANLMSKLDLHSRVELVEYAEQHGLLD